MDVLQVDVNKVIPYENNPRFNAEAVEPVANSIKEFGFQQPIVVDKDNIVIVGHTRLKAAKSLGLEKVPVVVATNLTSEQVDAYRLADNKVSEFSDWDFGLLNLELDNIEEIDMTDFGFNLDDLEDESEQQEDDYDGSVVEEPTSKLGNIYQLGRHRLMCGDSTKLDDVEKLMDGKLANLLITDPPYNINYQGRTKDKATIQNDKMDEDNFMMFLTDAFKAAMKNITDDASAYIWFSQLHSPAFYLSAESAGFRIRQQLIWNKNNITMGAPYRNKYEPCLFATVQDDYCWYSDKSQPTVMDVDRPSVNDLHPTMKPVPLFDYQIKNSSKKGDNVLDLFGGSGTTMIACESNNRNAYLMELDPHYVDTIINRWETLTGKTAEQIN